MKKIIEKSIQNIGCITVIYYRLVDEYELPASYFGVSLSPMISILKHPGKLDLSLHEIPFVINALDEMYKFYEESEAE